MLIRGVLVAVYIMGYSLLYFCLCEVLWPYMREPPNHKRDNDPRDGRDNNAGYIPMKCFLANVMVHLGGMSLFWYSAFVIAFIGGV